MDAPSATSLVTVLGGSGFLGRRVVDYLVAGGATVRVAVRHPERVTAGAKSGGRGGTTPIFADIGNEASIASAVSRKGASVVQLGPTTTRSPEASTAVAAARTNIASAPENSAGAA